MASTIFLLSAMTFLLFFIIDQFITWSAGSMLHSLFYAKRAIRSHAQNLLQGTEWLGGTTLLSSCKIICGRNPLIYPLTRKIRCIYHTELQGRLGHAFVRNFHQCSSLCNGLSDLMIPFNAFFMEFHRFSLIFVISFRFYVRTGVLSMGWKRVAVPCVTADLFHSSVSFHLQAE